MCFRFVRILCITLNLLTASIYIYICMSMYFASLRTHFVGHNYLHATTPSATSAITAWVCIGFPVCSLTYTPVAQLVSLRVYNTISLCGGISHERQYAERKCDVMPNALRAHTDTVDGKHKTAVFKAELVCACMCMWEDSYKLYICMCKWLVKLKQHMKNWREHD